MASEFEYVPSPTASTNENPTWGDYGKSITSGVTGGVLAPGAAVAREATQDRTTINDTYINDMARILQRHLNTATDDINESRTDVARKRAEAAITSPEFWEHPISASMLKASGMTGPLAAAVFSGGPVGAALVGGAMSAGSYLNEIDKALDAANDGELRKNSYYDSLRSMGMDEEEARVGLKRKLVGNKDILNFAVGSLAGAIGPAGKLAAGAAGKTAIGLASKEAGLGARAGLGAAEGGVSNAAQAGVEDATVQNSLIEGGFKKDFDEAALVNTVLEGGALGAAMGAAGGAFAGRGKGKAKAEEIKSKRAVEEAPDEPIVTPEVKAEDVNQQSKGTGTGNQSPPVETAPVGNEQNAPVRSETNYPKAKARKGKSQKAVEPTAEVVEPGAPSVAETAAIKDLQQKVMPEPVVPEAPRAPEPAQWSPPDEAAIRAAGGDPELTQRVKQKMANEAPDTAARAQDIGIEMPAPEVKAPINTEPVKVEIVPSPPAAVATPEPVKPVEPRKPRVLERIKDKATQEAEAKAAKEAFKAAEANARQVAAEEVGVTPKGKNWTKKEVEDRAASAENARVIFDKHVPDNDNIPTDAPGRARLRERLGAMLDEAKKADVKIPVKVGYEGTSDHIVYLRAATDLHKKLGQKGFTGVRAAKQINDFMIGERAAKGGDFSALRESRKVEGDIAKRVDQGNVEERGIAAPDAEKEPVVTAIAKSGRGPVRIEASEEKVASAGRKLEGAEKAKAIAELNARMAKGKVEAARIDRPEPPKPVEAPKPAEKIAEIKAKAKPPEATNDKVVTQAGKKTNLEPSDAQKEAGNYAKGTVEWNGLHVAIENPKGSTRKGMAKIGGMMREWSAKMQDHYGYIKRSMGADGDQVDVFMGPNPKSDNVWVIHQQDFNGKFDEHKAMLGYDSKQEAMYAYDRAFSDGRGFERIKDVEEMNPAEFKQWVHSDKPRKAKKEAESIDSALRTDVNDKLGTNGKVEAIKTLKARDALKDLNLEHLSGVPKALAKVAQERFAALVGDTEVHILDKYEMARATGDVKTAFVDNAADGVRGLATMKMADGRQVVLLRADQFKTPEATAHAVLHEIAHVATMRALVEDAALHRKVTRMMEETEAFLKDVPDIRKQLDYALTDEREFIAEAFSNPKVQEILSSVPLSDSLARDLGLSRSATAWDAIVDIVRKTIQKVTGSFPEGMRMIEGIMRLGPEFDAHINRVKTRKMLGLDTPVKPHEAFDTSQVTAKLMGEVKQFVSERIKGEGIQEQAGKPWLMALRTVDDLAQAAASHWRDSNPVRRVADVLEMTRVKAANWLRRSEPVMAKMLELEKKYTGKVWDDFTALLHDETMANVHADRDLAGNSHLGKDVLGTHYAKELHAGLAERWNALPDDLKAARGELLKEYSKRQNEMSLGLMKNRVAELLGHRDDELARRIHEDRTLDTDADLIGGQDALDAIKEVSELSKIEGPYVPLIRRGDWVVRGEYDVPAPKGAKTATQIAKNEYEFKSRAEAVEYEKQLAREGAGKPTVKSRWVDPKTGEKTFPDGTKVTSKDIDAEQRFRVTVQNKHVEFLENQHEAQKRAFELAQNGNIHVQGVEARKFEYDKHSDLFSREFQNMVSRIRGSQRFKDLDKSGQAAVISELHQAALRSLGSTRVQSKSLPRRYVEGASKDLTRNMLEYMQSSSGYLAKLEHQPQLEVALKDMNDRITDDDHKTSSIARSAIAHEINKRVSQNEAYDEGGAWSAVTKRIMTLSFLDKLAGPSHNIINSLQPSMVTFPVLAGRYGVGKSFDALSRAYRDVGGLGIVKSGLKDTVKKVRNGEAVTTDLLGDIKAGLSTKEKAMIDYLAERGSIDPDSGFEIDRLVKSRDGVGGKIDAGLGRFESIARQMPQAIEMINRSVTALAAYRLEMSRGATHEKAMVKAQETVNSTQGLYSASNAAPIFNHPVAKLSLQFKKYGQMMYSILGTNIGKAFKNAEPGDRAEALKTLAGITATHVAMAGALGLPTEPFKYLLMGAQAAGLTNTGWSDVENSVREKAANWFGKTGGELVTKGLPRALGIDLSSRVGLDSLTSFGEPRSSKEEDVKKWMFDTLAGAPVGLVGDWAKGMNSLTTGDFTKAAELLVPMKFAADSIKAYRLATEGKKGSTGKETMTPYNMREAITRAAGFTPAREAEEGAMRSAFYSNQKRDSAERTALITSWVTGKGSDKSSAWKTIQSWNKGKPREAQISMSDLTKAGERRRKEGNAVKTNKRDQQYWDRAEATYNN